MNTEKAEGGGVPPRLPAAGGGVGWPAGRLGKAVGVFIFFTLVASAVYALIGAVRAPGAAAVSTAASGKVRSDYVLMLLESCLGLLILFLPSMLEKRFRIILPSRMYLLFVVFLYAAIFLGEVRDFYYRIPHWDVILHAFSGIMLGALGFSIVSLLNKSEKVAVTLRPQFVALYAFSFALSLGVIWEIYEFAADGVLGLNMQKFALEDKTSLVGRAALVDTMKDLIVDALAALAVSVFGFLSMKAEKSWIARVALKRKPEAVS